MDITMPGHEWPGALERIASNYPDVRVIMLTMHDNEEYVGTGAEGRRGRLLAQGLGPSRAGYRDPIGRPRRVVSDTFCLPTRDPRLHAPTGGRAKPLRASHAATDGDRATHRGGPPQRGDRVHPRDVDEDGRDASDPADGPPGRPRRHRPGPLCDPRRARPVRQVIAGRPPTRVALRFRSTAGEPQVFSPIPRGCRRTTFERRTR